MIKNVGDFSCPYVYKATNKHTGEFYFGYRTHHLKNGSSINEDLGVKYFSSCNTILENKNDFAFSTVLVCKSSKMAYYYEQKIIQAYWGDPKLINKHYADVDSGKYFRCDGHSDKTKKKISESMIGIKRRPETIEKMKIAAKERVEKFDCYKNFKGAPVGRVQSDFERLKRSQKAKEAGTGSWMIGRQWFTNGIDSKQCFPENKPDGWICGRTVKHKGDSK